MYNNYVVNALIYEQCAISTSTQSTKQCISSIQLLFEVYQENFETSSQDIRKRMIIQQQARKTKKEQEIQVRLM